ncbi:MAG: ferritin-like domain-containing protein [Myxococcales bacterium]|nr:ferritin-like domain-containing protein [Myxococcales bacterium]
MSPGEPRGRASSPSLSRGPSGAPTLSLHAAIARRAALTLPELGLSERERRAVLESWRARVGSEYASARVFAALVPQAMAAGLDADSVHALTEMAAEELDHAVRCARVVVALGGAGALAECALPALPEVPTHADASPLEALLRNVLDVSCISETVAVALVGSERELAATPELEAELAAILADEVGHARFGWRLLEVATPSLTPRARTRLGAYLACALRERVDSFAPFLGHPEASRAAQSLGAPAGPATFQVFVETIEQITVPGLERLGLPARRAWEVALSARAA